MEGGKFVTDPKEMMTLETAIERIADDYTLTTRVVDLNGAVVEQMIQEAVAEAADEWTENAEGMTYSDDQIVAHFEELPSLDRDALWTRLVEVAQRLGVGKVRP